MKLPEIKLENNCLIIHNTTDKTYINWYLKCDKFIKSLKDFTVSTLAGESGMYVLYPDKELQILKPDDEVIRNIEYDEVPIFFDFFYHKPPTGVVFDIDFKKTKYIKDIFSFIYNYDKTKIIKPYTGIDPNPQYFELTDKGLKLSLYEDDNEPLIPSKNIFRSTKKTELRCLMGLFYNLTYIIEWTEFVTIETLNNDYTMLEVYPYFSLIRKKNQYKIAYNGYESILLFENSNKPNISVKWIIHFKSGYVQITMEPENWETKTYHFNIAQLEDTGILFWGISTDKSQGTINRLLERISLKIKD